MQPRLATSSSKPITTRPALPGLPPSVLLHHRDGTTRVWDAASGAQRARLIAFTDGEWLTITPEGFFDASERGANLLSVVRGLEAYAIDQFYQSLYRPDLVREKLAGEPQMRRLADALANLEERRAILEKKATEKNNFDFSDFQAIGDHFKKGYEGFLQYRFDQAAIEFYEGARKFWPYLSKKRTIWDPNLPQLDVEIREAMLALERFEAAVKVEKAQILARTTRTSLNWLVRTTS